MFKIMVLAALAALLSGCAASSISESGGQASDIADSKFAEKDVVVAETTATIGTSATEPSPNGKNPRPAKAMPAARVDVGGLQNTAEAISAVATPGSAAYKIGPHDVLEVSVFKVAELSASAQVSEAGTINYPLIGEVPAAGKTAREVEQDLTRSLGNKYLQKPQVRVFVKEFNSQRVTVEGAVKSPGVFPIQGAMSLLQAVAMAKGLEGVSDNTVLVFRSTAGKRSAARFDVSDIRTGDAEDPQLQAGDVVVAGTSALKEGFGNIMKVFPIASAFMIL